MNRKAMYLNATILRGRRLKDGEEGAGGQSGGANSGAGGDNGGNSGDSSGQAQNGQNNDGAQLDPNQFWHIPEAKDGENGTQGDGDGGGEDIGQQIVGEIGKFTLGTPIFDDSIAGEIAEGKLDGINARFNQMSQAVLKQSVMMAARIMQQFEKSMDERISGAINSSQTVNRDESLLKEHFPSFGQVAMQPMIRGVFQQSLTHTKGDRAKAIEMTKGMLRSMGQIGRTDFGITEAPRNPDDVYGADSSKSLVRDLLEMK